MTFFSLLTTALSSVFYGIIVTVVVMALLYVLLKSVNTGIVQSFVFYITGVVLAILLITQFSLMIGAMQAMDAADAAEIFLSQQLEHAYGIVNAQESQQVMDAVTDQFPIIGNFLDMANFAGNEISELPEKMHACMADYLNGYIWHRVWWALGMIVVATAIVILYAQQKLSTSTKKPTYRPTAVSRKNYDDF